MIGIYKITSPSGRVYVGQSTNIEKRFKSYKKLSNNIVSQKKLYRSFVKYGVENHIFEIVEECDVLTLNEKERYYQDFYNVLEFGLNLKLTSTSDRICVHSEETKKKISVGNKGKVISEKNLLFLRTNAIGRKLNKTQIEALQNGRKQKKLSDDSRKKMSLSHIGKKWSPESIAKRTATLKLKPKSKGKLVLDLNNGIYYNSALEASRSKNMSLLSISRRLTGKIKNETGLIYV